MNYQIFTFIDLRIVNSQVQLLIINTNLFIMHVKNIQYKIVHDCYLIPSINQVYEISIYNVYHYNNYFLIIRNIGKQWYNLPTFSVNYIVNSVMFLYFINSNGTLRVLDQVKNLKTESPEKHNNIPTIVISYEKTRQYSTNKMVRSI